MTINLLESTMKAAENGTLTNEQILEAIYDIENWTQYIIDFANEKGDEEMEENFGRFSTDLMCLREDLDL